MVRIGGNVSDGHESGVKGDDRDDDGECDQVVVTTVVETSDDNERLNVFWYWKISDQKFLWVPRERKRYIFFLLQGRV